MNRFFSLPVVAGILGGVLFPYQSLNLVWAASILLFFLLLFNVLEVDVLSALSALRGTGKLTALRLALLFGFFPVLQTVAASLVLTDRDHIFGVAMASLAPPALVVPMFLRRRGGNVAGGVSIVVLATLLYPLLLVPMIHMLGFSAIYIDTRALFLYLTLLTVAPVLCAMVFSLLLPRMKLTLLKHVAVLNSLVLGLLMFILVGSALNHVPLRTWRSENAVWLTVLLLWMDFGVYFLLRWTWDKDSAILLSCRNFAIPASLLLFFDPKAALAPAIGLVVHAVFFQWLMFKEKASSVAGDARAIRNE